ncbi:MAG: fumarylacetoacetase [Rhodobacteraceae bacterium]|nr:fumarylacetoacetase [Paracoccaceae bacterium]
MQSWIDSANRADGPFPVQNLPYGIFSRDPALQEPVCGVAIGDMILDLAVLEQAGLMDMGNGPVFDLPFLNGFMELGPEAWTGLRQYLTEILRKGGDDALSGNPELQKAALFPLADATMFMPFLVAEFTDFYASKHHATHVGTLFRGAENALPPNWLHMPIGYNGRASSVVVSGSDIHRPMGQIKPDDAETPHFGPAQRVDFELELGAVIGVATEMGQPVSTAQADKMIFGYVLLNDWSARDIQAWEYQPLGPFQAKAFGTSISPWVVPKAALERLRCKAVAPDKPLLPYLSEQKPGLYDITLEASIQPENATRATTICRTNYNRMYYSSAQQLAHHASSGCPMNCGDLLGSGTISGPETSEYGSLLEKSEAGQKPFILDTGETRTFIEDYDRITLTGWAQGDGYRIGFGECTGRIIPPLPEPDWKN